MYCTCRLTGCVKATGSPEASCASTANSDELPAGNESPPTADMRWLSVAREIVSSTRSGSVSLVVS